MKVVVLPAVESFFADSFARSMIKRSKGILKAFILGYVAGVAPSTGGVGAGSHGGGHDEIEVGKFHDVFLRGDKISIVNFLVLDWFV